MSLVNSIKFVSPYEIIQSIEYSYFVCKQNFPQRSPPLQHPRAGTDVKRAWPGGLRIRDPPAPLFYRILLSGAVRPLSFFFRYRALSELPIQQNFLNLSASSFYLRPSHALTQYCASKGHVTIRHCAQPLYFLFFTLKPQPSPGCSAPLFLKIRVYSSILWRI